jgi:hypothetical protein
LTDEHANTTQIRAHILNRDGIVGQLPHQVRQTRMPDPQKHILQAQPWVRQFMASQDLIFGIEWSGQSNSAGSAYCSLGLRGGDTLFRIDRPALALFEEELTDVMRMADLRSERTEEILSQIDHQWALWGSILPMRPDQKPRTFEALQAVVWFAISIEMRFKQVLGVWRPQDLSPMVQPIITTPGHGSFPMGHATQAFAVAQTLKRLLRLSNQDPLALQLGRQAFRIAVNRIVAGVHFPVDAVAGMLLGQAVADWAGAQASATPTSVTVRHFTETTYRGGGHWMSLGPTDPALSAFDCGRTQVSAVTGQVPVWRLLWRQAMAEWE